MEFKTYSVGPKSTLNYVISFTKYFYIESPVLAQTHKQEYAKIWCNLF